MYNAKHTRNTKTTFKKYKIIEKSTNNNFVFYYISNFHDSYSIYLVYFVYFIYFVYFVYVVYLVYTDTYLSIYWESYLVNARAP